MIKIKRKYEELKKYPNCKNSGERDYLCRQNEYFRRYRTWNWNDSDGGGLTPPQEVWEQEFSYRIGHQTSTENPPVVLSDFAKSATYLVNLDSPSLEECRLGYTVRGFLESLRSLTNPNEKFFLSRGRMTRSSFLSVLYPLSQSQVQAIKDWLSSSQSTAKNITYESCMLATMMTQALGSEPYSTTWECLIAPEQHLIRTRTLEISLRTKDWKQFVSTMVDYMDNQQLRLLVDSYPSKSKRN